MMGDWEDVFGSCDVEYDGDRFEDEDQYDPRDWSSFDETSYQDILELAQLGEWYSALIIENHVFTTYDEAANAARKLAIKTQSSVRVFINHEKKIYSIYDPIMNAAINSLKCYEIDHGRRYYPKSPLIRLREKDIIYHDGRGDWLFVAHPNGKTEILERNLRDCIRRAHCSNPFDRIEKNSDWTRSKRPVALNRSLKANTINERDDILNRALIIAKAKKIQVYVVGHWGINSSTHYVVFTENKINELIGKDIKFYEKLEAEKQQRLNKRKEIDDYNNQPEIIEMKKNAKGKISKILLDIINKNYFCSYHDGLNYGRNNDEFFLVSTNTHFDENRNGIFQLIHLIMCEEGIYKTILSDKQCDGIEEVIAGHPVSIFRHAGIGKGEILESTLEEIYKESITYAAKQLDSLDLGGWTCESNYKLYKNDYLD